MSDLNCCNLIGTVATDPELSETTNGVAVLKFRLANNQSRPNPKTGGWLEYANYFTVKVFGVAAERKALRLAKGCRVVVTAEARYSEWESEGRHCSKVEFVANSINVIADARPVADQVSTGQTPSVADKDIDF